MNFADSNNDSFSTSNFMFILQTQVAQQMKLVSSHSHRQYFVTRLCIPWKTWGFGIYISQ